MADLVSSAWDVLKGVYNKAGDVYNNPPPLLELLAGAGLGAMGADTGPYWQARQLAHERRRTRETLGKVAQGLGVPVEKLEAQQLGIDTFPQYISTPAGLAKTEIGKEPQLVAGFSSVKPLRVGTAAAQAEAAQKFEAVNGRAPLPTDDLTPYLPTPDELRRRELQKKREESDVTQKAITARERERRFAHLLDERRKLTAAQAPTAFPNPFTGQVQMIAPPAADQRTLASIDQQLTDLIRDMPPNQRTRHKRELQKAQGNGLKAPPSSTDPLGIR